MAHFFNDQQGQQAADLQFQSFDYGNARSMAGGNAGSGGSYGQSGYGQAYSSDYSSSIQDSQQTISWVAAFGTGDYPDEPPLLEELGINFSHIKEKAISVLNPLTPIDKHIFDESDLAGPVFFWLLYGGFQLFVSWSSMRYELK
ncbi:hypothetical protein HDU83_003821 [Entophlyctis luteolus]|nr:hypothetical protein HDU82_001156 [Entophlyctis luteolus]KAJ3355244.1 hypothetical protein HDU83_003821 [Entophlyctis luteolus]